MKIIITLQDGVTKEEFQSYCAIQLLVLSIVFLATIGLPCAYLIFLKIHGG